MTKREMILEGINYWEEKEKGKWISSDVARYIFDTYQVEVSNKYINMVRADVGVSWTDMVYEKTLQKLYQRHGNKLK